LETEFSFITMSPVMLVIIVDMEISLCVQCLIPVT
jgi:hypothetical protein